jgi:hypothetical protein
VSWCRFRAVGDAPGIADETALSVLTEGAFREQDIGAPDETESGWTTGEHLYDTQFTYEKNGFGDMLLFALRIDTHKVPSDVKHAYKRIQEMALAQQKDNPTGFLSKREKREAGELASRQLHEELAAGKFRRSKAIQVLWDLREKSVYFASTAASAAEQLALKFRESFNVDLEAVTSGGLASGLLRDHGQGRDFEDLRPSSFTPPPAAATAESDEEEEVPARPEDPTVPLIPWTAQSLETKDFLGNELLIWLWWWCEKKEGLIELPADDGTARKDTIAVAIDKALDMDCAWGVGGRQTLRGDGPTRLAEAGKALATGKWPRKASLILADTADSAQWELTLQADRLNVSGCSLPAVEDVQTPREEVEHRLLLVRRLSSVLDRIMRQFLDQRLSQGWGNRRQQIREWISTRGR